jgi:hypothetical protein
MNNIVIMDILFEIRGNCDRVFSRRTHKFLEVYDEQEE